MKVLTDKGIMFRTFPVMPRKRVKFDPGVAVEFTEYGSEVPAFQCLGGYFTHNSYRLLDYFVSHWFETARHHWVDIFGDKIPSKFDGDSIEKLSALSPILNINTDGPLNIENDLVGLCQRMGKYVVIDSISDRVVRSYLPLKGISSEALKEIIDRTASARLKVNYSIRRITTIKKKKILGYRQWSNLATDRPWYKIFDYRILDEVKGKDGRILERIYKFGFKNPLGLAMIHNTICGGSWSVNPALYQLSPDAQLLYRYLIITGSRWKNNAAGYLAHRLGWREKQKSRIIQRLKLLFEKMQEAELIKSFETVESRKHGCLFSHELPSKRTKKKKGK